MKISCDPPAVPLVFSVNRGIVVGALPPVKNSLFYCFLFGALLLVSPIHAELSSPTPTPTPSPDASAADQPGPMTMAVRQDPDTPSGITPEAATLSPIARNADKPNALDLQTCFRYTAIRNDTLKISLEDILIARAQLSQQIANLWPTFTVSNQQQFVHYVNPRGTSFINNTFSNSPRNYNSDSHVEMTMTLFNGGQNWNNIAGADATLQSKKFTLQRSYQTIYQSVAQAFYQILQYEGDLAVLQDLAQALDARDRELQDRVKIGRSRPAELLQAEVTLATTRVTIEQTKGSLANAKETLAYYTGIPSKDLEVKETQKLPATQALEAYLIRTKTRPDILAEIQTLRETRRAFDAARGQLLPTVTANGDYLASQDPVGNNTDGTMTIQVSAPIFDGGLIIGRINENRETVRQTALRLDDLYRTSDEATRQAYAALNSSLAQVAVLREASVLSAQNFQAQLSDYRKGVVTNLDVLTALQDFQNTRQTLHDADMGAHINLINLYVAAGLAATGPGADNHALPTSTVHDYYQAPKP